MKYCGNGYMKHSMKDVLHGKIHLELCYDSPQVKQNYYFLLSQTKSVRRFVSCGFLGIFFLMERLRCCLFSVQLGNKKISKLHGSQPLPSGIDISIVASACLEIYIKHFMLYLVYLSFILCTNYLVLDLSKSICRALQIIHSVYESCPVKIRKARN